MEQFVVSLFLIFFALEFIVEFILNELNLRHVRARRAHQDIPEFFRGKLSADEYDKSVEYTLAKGRFQRWSEIYGRVITLVILFGGVLSFFDQFAGLVAQQFSLGVYGQGIIFCLAVAVYFTVAGLMTDLYSTFALEAKFGFNKMTLGLYLTDKLKGLVLGLLIGVPFLFVILWLMQATGSLWWIWAFVFISVFQLVMIVIFPNFIAPWFNKFEPLTEGAL